MNKIEYNNNKFRKKIISNNNNNNYNNYYYNNNNKQMIIIKNLRIKVNFKLKIKTTRILIIFLPKCLQIIIRISIRMKEIKITINKINLVIRHRILIFKEIRLVLQHHQVL